MGAVEWGRDVAEAYDATAASMFAPDVLDPAVALLSSLAGSGAGGRPVLELAIGTGRVALPLRSFGGGLDVHGIELSAAMVDVLRRKPGGADVPVVVGDMSSSSAPAGEGAYALVYVVWNSLMNLTTQREQVDTFRNAARHLAPGGRFVVELMVPNPLPGGASNLFLREVDQVGVETFDDPVGQIASSHHWMAVDGRLVHHSAAYRYVWPSELDLMAEVAGLHLEHRWADWLQSGFTSVSTGQVAVYRS